MPVRTDHKIIAEGDTLIIHYSLFVFHYSLSEAFQLSLTTSVAAKQPSLISA